MTQDGSPFGNEFRRQCCQPESQKILYLTREDDHGYSAREPDDYRMRNELDCRSHPGDAEFHQYDASHQRRDDQPVDAEALHDSVNDYDECSGWFCDLDTRSTQRGDQKPSDDRGI